MHYNTYYLDKSKKLELLLEAKSLAYSIILHELNTDVGVRRMNTDKSFEEIMELFKNNKIHFFVGKRFNNLDNEYYGEVSATTLLPSNTNYFIFTYLDETNIDLLLKKYTLI